MGATSAKRLLPHDAMNAKLICTVRCLQYCMGPATPERPAESRAQCVYLSKWIHFPSPTGFNEVRISTKTVSFNAKTA